MPRTRRTQAQLYPKLLTFQQAREYYESIPPLRGHGGTNSRPLAKGKRTFCPWRITQVPNGIACMRSTHAVLTYYEGGYVRISPSASAAQELAIIRAIAPIDSAKWDYYNDCLVVHVNGTRYTCKAGENITFLPAEP